jgi:hypothetical protein
MSTADTGDNALVARVLGDAKANVEAARAQAEQLDMLEPVSPEDMLEAQEALGPHAGKLAVLKHARAVKRGRPAGSRNKRTDDFARYLLSFGQHPAITMMQIQTTAPEVLQANSRRTVTKVINGGKGCGDKVIQIEEETLTYEGAQSLRLRASEGLMPYLESKKPVAIDMTFTGVADLMIEGVTHSRAEMDDYIEGDFLPVDGDAGEGE